jgi:hypothetical protein
VVFQTCIAPEPLHLSHSPGGIPDLRSTRTLNHSPGGIPDLRRTRTLNHNSGGIPDLHSTRTLNLQPYSSGIPDLRSTRTLNPSPGGMPDLRSTRNLNPKPPSQRENCPSRSANLPSTPQDIQTRALTMPTAINFPENLPRWFLDPPGVQRQSIREKPEIDSIAEISTAAKRTAPIRKTLPQHSPVSPIKMLPAPFSRDLSYQCFAEFSNQVSC